MKKLTIIITFILLFGMTAKAQHWNYLVGDSLKLSIMPGSGPQLEYLKVINNILYVSGGFDYVGSTFINYVGTWDGNNWITISDGTNTGIPSDWVYDIEYYNGQTYFGGNFMVPFASRFASWNGSNWATPTDYPNASVDELKSYNGKLYVAGQFLYIGSNFMPVFAEWDGANWSQGSQLPNDNIYALEVYNGELYAGGSFDHFGSTETFYVARYDGTSWKPVAGGMDNYVFAMTVDTFNNFLYIGGRCSNLFDEHGTAITVDGVGLWDGFGWHSVGNGSPFGEIYEDAMAVYRGDLYVGEFYPPKYSIRRWDGIKWDTLQGGLNGNALSLAVYKDSLYVAGDFSTVNGDTVPQGLATWFMPDTGCRYVKPMVHTLADTFKINSGQPTVNVQFYNNNAFVDSWAWDFGDTGTGNTQSPAHTYTATGTYNVSCTVTHNACIKTANKTIVVIDNTGIDEYTKENLSFKLYPNPTSSDITVECTLPQNKKGELKTHNANGSMKDSYALQGGVNKIRIPSTGLVTGVSLVSVFVDGGFVLSEKVVKQ